MTRLRWTTIVVLLLSTVPVSAQTLRLTVNDAIERGMQTSHQLAGAVARGEAASAVADQRHAVMLPQVTAQAGYTRTNHVDEFGILQPGPHLFIIYPDIPDNYRTRLDLQWLLYSGGRQDALERAARAEAMASADEVAATRADLILEISRAYWGLVTAREALRVVEQSVVQIDAHVKDVRNLLDAGFVPPNDLFSAEAQASRERMLSVQAAAARDVAEAELARLVGVPGGTPIEPVDPPEAPAPERRPLDDLIDAARRQRPERAALLKRVRAAEERTTAATAAKRPTVGVAGGFDYANPNPRVFPREDAWHTSWDAGLNVNWSIFNGGRVRSEIAEAAAIGRNVRERLNDFDSALAVEVRQRQREVEAARASIAAATDAVRSATEARRVVGERFAAGVATSTDVLDAQVALLQAELDRTRALASARLADAQLVRAVGQ
ncbi:MAG TPA: TolC family protein [Gemmatimonadaceae bacterium]|nr:TolC family protein [Gemmatimonadaceae bacterium]